MKLLTDKMLQSVEFYGVILCLLLFATYYSLRQTDKREIWVAHSNEVLMQLTSLQLLAAKGELSARNYSLSGERTFVQEFNHISQAAIDKLAYIENLVKDNQSITPTLDSVQMYLHQRIAFHSQMIKARTMYGLNGSLKSMKAEQEVFKPQRLVKYIRQIDSSEKKLMTLRMAESAKAAQLRNFYLLLTAIFVPGLLFIRIRRTRKEAGQRTLLLKDLLINAERMNKAEKLASFGVWNVDLENGQINCSAEMYRIWGFDLGKIGGTLDNYLSRVHPEDYNFVKRKMSGLNDQNGNDDYAFRLLQDGRVTNVSTGTSVIRDSNGVLESITGYAQDITEKTNAAADLTVANYELKILFNRIGDVLFSRDVKRNCFIQISETCLQVFGYSSEEFMNDVDLWQTVVHPEDRQLMQQGRGALHDGKQFTIEFRIIHKDGSERWVENSVVPTMDDDQQLLRFDGVIRDITQTKIQALERVKMMDDLLQRNSTLEQFTYIVSHQLRAPVANIVGLGEILESLDDYSPQKLQIQAHVISSVRKLDVMICDLNLVLRVREQANEKKQMVYFKEILCDVITSLPYLKAMENIAINGYFDQLAEIYSVRSYISNIFYNLILNSINYRRDNVKTVISISAIVNKTGVALIFKDNGKGIDLVKNHATLFELYSRFDQSVVGKGMGLFVVKTQVELLGGAVEVQSELNLGTTFVIQLPTTKAY